MKKMISKIRFVLLVLLLCVSAAAETALPQEEMNSILASVNGQAISLRDILPMTRVKEYQAYAAYSGTKLEQAIRQLRRQAVDELIDRKLIISAYSKQPYRIAQSDIEHELDQAAIRMGCRSRGEFRQRLRENRCNIDEFRKEIEERMIFHFMLQRQMAIIGSPTPKEVYEYFQSHRKELSGIDTYELAMLKLDSSVADFNKTAAGITAILASSPERFAELVRRYAPGSRDGRLGAIEPSKMRIEFISAIKTPVEGKVYGPIKLNDGVVWLRLLKHNKAADASFESVHQQIIKILEGEQRKKAVELYTRDLRRDAVLEYFF